MKRLLAALVGFAVVIPTPAFAQSNDNDYTPLNSRIRRERQFPTSLHNPWGDQMTEVASTRSRAMMTQFSRCVYQRNRTAAVDLLDKTDYGFVTFDQVGLDQDRALRIYGFSDCLSRVANTHGTGVQLRFSPGSLRGWLVQEAYFDRYADEPTWVQGGNIIAAREFPLSEQNGSIQAAMDLADCIVTADPYTADYFFRTTAGTDAEKQALQGLVPSIGPCIPDGHQVQLQPAMLRMWIGEGLWHAATHSASVPAASSESAN